MPSWNKDELPVPCTDPDRLKRDLDEFGYCLVAEALSSTQVAAIRTRLEEQIAAERSLSVNHGNEAHTDATNSWVSMLINKGEVFREVAVNPKALALVEHILGPEFLLSATDAHIVRPGGSPMGLHVDQWWLPREAPAGERRQVGIATRKNIAVGSPDPVEGPIWRPAVCNVIYMISDFTEANGGTRIVPKSHRSGHQPDGTVPHPYASVAAEGPAGTALVFEGRMWHAAGLNISNDARIGMPTYYCGPQFRQLSNFTFGTRREVLRGASPELLKLLGFRIFSTYGSVDESGAEMVDFEKEPLGELRLAGDTR